MVSPLVRDRKLAAILSGDVVGYSRLITEDEAGTVAALGRCRAEVERLVPSHRGRLVDFTGDNFLAEFPTATDAVQCVVAIQGVALPPLRLRMGLHLGEVRVEGERLFGAGVNLAARLEGIAEPGGLCVSAVVRDELHRAADMTFESLGAQHFKNLPEPVEAYRVVWRQGAAPVSGRAPSVAVLPFVNMSAEPDQEFFADGMAEELINALTRVEGLRVIARTSAFSFKGTSADIATIGHRLGVEHVVEGSVRKAGDRLRISAQLVEVAGGHHLWSESFDRGLQDVFEIQDEIARTVAERIGPRLIGETPASLVQPTTRSTEAYELYLRAGDRMWRTERWEIRTAIEMLRDATRIDPGFADAWARLATACCDLTLAFEDDPRWHELAKQALGRSFALDPDGAEAHLARARVMWSPGGGFQNEAALRASARSLALRPGSYRSLVWHGVILYHVGLLDDARELQAAALAAEPDDAMTMLSVAQTAWAQRRYDVAEEYARRCLDRAPDFLLQHLLNSAIWLYLDDLDRAEKAIATARGLVGNEPLLDANEALLWARRGDESRALEAIARAAEDKRSLAHKHHAHHAMAAAYALLDRKQEAVELLRLASSCGLPNLPLFTTDPHLASLQNEPAMQQLVAELAEKDAVLRAEFGNI